MERSAEWLLRHCKNTIQAAADRLEECVPETHWPDEAWLKCQEALKHLEDYDAAKR